jgi:hypothetical protein
MRLDAEVPVRPARTSRRCVTGKVPLTTGRMAHFESSLERDWLILLDFDSRVERILEQPFTINHEHDGKSRRYTPDVLASYKYAYDRWTEVYEVKPLAVLKADWNLFRPRFKAAVHFCRERGWRFRIITERHLRTDYCENVKFLRRYRDDPVQELHRDAIFHAFRKMGETTPKALIAGLWNDQEKRYAALAELWRLVATRRVETSLSIPLAMNSRIWLA